MVIQWKAYPPALLKSLKTSYTSGLPWEKKKHDSVKSKLKELLFNLQKSRCAYCRREIGDEAGKVEIDHVLPKAPFGNAANHSSNDDDLRRHTSGYMAFSFTPNNLVLTCKRCNNKKGTYDPRRNRANTPKAYPKSANSFIWVHPHFHAYRDHIQIQKGFIYRQAKNSPNGGAVIDVCDLANVAAVELRARERAVKGAKSLTKAILGLAPHVDHWSDQQLISFLLARFNHAKVPMLRLALLELKGTRATTIAKFAAAALS